MGKLISSCAPVQIVVIFWTENFIYTIVNTFVVRHLKLLCTLHDSSVKGSCIGLYNLAISVIWSCYQCMVLRSVYGLAISVWSCNNCMVLRSVYGLAFSVWLCDQ